jgi:hypothetical protein
MSVSGLQKQTKTCFGLLYKTGSIEQHAKQGKYASKHVDMICSKQQRKNLSTNTKHRQEITRTVEKPQTISIECRKPPQLHLLDCPGQ